MVAGAVEDMDRAFRVLGDVLVRRPDREVVAPVATEVTGGERVPERVGTTAQLRRVALHAVREFGQVLVSPQEAAVLSFLEEYR